MNKKDLRIIFMGTPDFAVESLRILVENNYNIVGVITMPDKPAGRGQKVQYSAVKKYTLEKNIPLLQPEKLKEESFISELRAWNADLQIVVAFRMLPEIVWDMPKYGTFNLHASLLPQYRGAAPINWAIINGETETGVSTFFLTHEIDTGKIIFQEKIAITENDNAGKIHDELMCLGAKLVQKTVDMLIENKIDAIAQDQLYTNESELKVAPKIFKDTCRINWNEPVQYIHNLIRGLSPYPTAWTELVVKGNTPQTIKIYSADWVFTESQHPAGCIRTDNKTYLHIACGGGVIDVKELQFAGKRVMKIQDLLNGYKFQEESYFK